MFLNYPHHCHRLRYLQRLIDTPYAYACVCVHIMTILHARTHIMSLSSIFTQQCRLITAFLQHSGTAFGFFTVPGNKNHDQASDELKIIKKTPLLYPYEHLKPQTFKLTGLKHLGLHLTLLARLPYFWPWGSPSYSSKLKLRQCGDLGERLTRIASWELEHVNCSPKLGDIFMSKSQKTPWTIFFITQIPRWNDGIDTPMFQFLRDNFKTKVALIV